MTFSFSRLHAYEQCGYAFYLRYIEGRIPESNFYAANGKCMHEVLANVFSGITPIEQCAYDYANRFEEILETTKQSIMDNTFEKCMNYLCSLEPIDEKKYEVLSVEEKLSFNIGKFRFVGYADLVLRDRQNGEVILVDHKQANHFLKKDGTPLKNQSENFFAYKHQMYLYCKGIKDCMGLNVSRIVWNHYKDDGALTIIPYVQEDYDESMAWALDCIGRIKKDKRFGCKKSYILCSLLCDFRNDCEYLNDDE